MQEAVKKFIKSKIPANPIQKEHGMIAIVMVLGLVHGLIYIFLLPPWQHYEEPSHFEYAWLIASQHSLPEYPAYDQVERRKIASSMIEHDFFKGMGFLPDLDSQDQPIWIGVNVTGSLPLYHIIVALPLSMIQNADVDTQLYVARFVSFLMYLMTLWLAYKILCEFTSLGHPLRWIVPGSMALLPGFTELMTAVNNDVGATLVFSLFIFLSVRMIFRGFTIKRLIGIIFAVGLCLATKNTVLVALPLALFALVFSLRRSRWLVVVGGFFLAITLIVTIAVFSWGDASQWYRETSQKSTTQLKSPDAPLGKRAFHLAPAPLMNANSSVSQVLTNNQVHYLKGKKVTIGAWIWATSPTSVLLPILSVDGQTHREMVQVGTQPAFFAYHELISEESKKIKVILQVDPSQKQNDPATIFYDGIILLEGEWPLDTAPVFNDSNGDQGYWGKQSFTNEIRNSSAESTWPYVRPWVEMLSKKIPWAAHLSPTGLVNGIFDIQNSGWIYRATASNLYQSFWGKFGWAHISLPVACYQVIKWITIINILLGLFVLSRLSNLKSKTWKLAISWLGLAMLIIWVSVFIRGLPSLYGPLYIPTARYSYPAIIPTILVLSAGWCVWSLRHRLSKYFITVYFIAFLVLDFVSLSTILNFYKG